MITSPEDYLKHLYELQNNNFPTYQPLLPTDETIYEIDLNKRTVEAPKFLGVSLDHRAETIYFKFDRYYDNMDLTTTVCLIQYVNKNAKNEDGTPSKGRAYLVPFYDITHFKGEDKVLIPWNVGGHATSVAGPVEFAIKFYLLNDDKQTYSYNLNTTIATTEVLVGMNVNDGENEDFIIPDQTVEAIYAELNFIKESKRLTWIDLF